MKRRKFIQQAATGAAGITILPRHVLGGKGFIAPNDRINLGYIGAGKQMYHLLNKIGECPETVAVSASDVFKRKLDLMVDAATKNNTKNGTAHDVKGYHYYRELLEQDDLDAVVIASPDHWHAQMVIDAARAGKDIYCEKPLALTVEEGRAMVRATRKYDRVFQTGNMQRSWRDFRHAVELVRNGYIGEIKEVNVSVGEPVRQCALPEQEVPEGLDWNEWVGPSLYRPYHEELAPPDINGPWAWWRGYRNFGGGLITDWGAHMFDIVQWALDKDDSGPVKFLPPEEPAQSHGLTMVYDNDIRVNHKLWGGEKDGNAIQFIGSEGRIEVSRGFLRTFPNKELATQELKSQDERVYFSDNHYQDWIDAIKSRTRPISDVEIGHRTSSVCNVTNIAYELQRPLLWDPEKEVFTGDDDANTMVGRAYRGKWNYKNI
ncbi:Gfo/Idh/MocA family oxidoreductase [Membranicola marinus]|uniref:Gfo/Idh/MocA family oxidoreductase n=1 Tax=Membranihabitans marinus TaxID=1227546 RepID=A0A953L8R3_9BACT|nr:Gfo/Idh/MocA family oxidoreductase [Membranihabitans marinus]MBY5956833.1 Gfo/Idh/MocA family oxidoreductase [Membranihabitans marinus]